MEQFMTKLYVSIALAFAVVILASLWHGLSRMHLADNTTTENVAAETGK